MRAYRGNRCGVQRVYGRSATRDFLVQEVQSPWEGSKVLGSSQVKPRLKHQSLRRLLKESSGSSNESRSILSRRVGFGSPRCFAE